MYAQREVEISLKKHNEKRPATIDMCGPPLKSSGAHLVILQTHRVSDPFFEISLVHKKRSTGSLDISRKCVT